MAQRLQRRKIWCEILGYPAEVDSEVEQEILGHPAQVDSEVEQEILGHPAEVDSEDEQECFLSLVTRGQGGRTWPILEVNEAYIQKLDFQTITNIV